MLQWPCVPTAVTPQSFINHLGKQSVRLGNRAYSRRLQALESMDFQMRNADLRNCWANPGRICGQFIYYKSGS